MTSETIRIENPRPAGMAFCVPCGHLRAVHYRDGSEQGGGCGGIASGDAPVRCRCKGYVGVEDMTGPIDAHA